MALGIGPQESPDNPPLPVSIAMIRDAADPTDPPFLVSKGRESFHKPDQLEHVYPFLAEAAVCLTLGSAVVNAHGMVSIAVLMPIREQTPPVTV